MATKRRERLSPAVAVESIRMLDRQIHTLQRQVEELQRERWNVVRKEVIDKLAPLISTPIPNFDGIEEGIHECYESPSARCIYDEEMDPSHDFCVFCQQPHERK